MNELLSVTNLSVDYFQHGQPVTALRNVSVHLNAGETLALVGESGCGKSTLALAIMGLLPRNESKITSGSIQLAGRDLFSQSEESWRLIRGKAVAMVFQDPFSSFNPVLTIGYQLMEALTLDGGAPDERRAIDLLKRVHIQEPERILRSYPHQVSGGQRQRVMIAMALSRNPQILIADEPTTALDVTVQDEILKLLMELQSSTHMAMLFVTHNLALVKEVAQRVAVMRSGEVVEVGPVSDVLGRPQKDYTKELLDSTLTLKRKT